MTDYGYNTTGITVYNISKTPPLSRADGKGGVFDIRGISADYGQSIVGKIVLDGMCEGYGFAIIDGRGFNASTQELVDECLVVIGTHTCPTSVLNLSIEKGY
jgi:hypothetical protein